MDVYRVGDTREAYLIPSDWMSHIPVSSQLAKLNVASPQIYSLLPPQTLNDWYMSDPKWVDIEVLRDRIKVIRHQWLYYQYKQKNPMPLEGSILKLLEASDGLEDSKTITRDLPRLLSLIFMAHIGSKLLYSTEFLDMLGTRLKRFPENYQTIFKELMEFDPNNAFDRVAAYRRICRVFDEKFLDTDMEAKQLSDKTKSYAANFHHGGMLTVQKKIEVSFDTPEQFEQSETFGLARSIGNRPEQLDGAIYSGDIWAVMDGHRESKCLNHFQTHFETRIREALALPEVIGPASVYNAVNKAILDFNDELLEVVQDPDGLVFMLGIKHGEYLHLFSLGDCTAVLCHPDKSPERLFPPQHIHKPNLDKTETIDKRLFNQTLQRGGLLVSSGNNMRLSHDGYGLEMTGALGDKDVPGVTHRPLYRMLSLEDLRGHTLLGYSDGVDNHLTIRAVNEIVKSRKECSVIARECVQSAIKKAYARKTLNPQVKPDNAICMALKF